MLKIVGIVLIGAAGVFGYIAYDEYQKANVLNNKLEDFANSMGEIVGAKKQSVKKEFPKETWYYGCGAVVALGMGLSLVLKK